MPIDSCVTASQRIPGSFRDPDGYVFIRDGRVFRALIPEAAQRITDLESSGLLGRFIADGRLVQTSHHLESNLIDELRRENPGFDSFIEHDPLPFVTYPYEWSISMLADAAITTLELQRDLLTEGYSLKDATAYNIQFIRGAPVFIDITSIEQPSRRDIWYPLGQFNRMFTFPLMLCRRREWDIARYFRGGMDGLDTARMAKTLGSWGLLRPESWMDVTLPLWFERFVDRKAAGAETANQTRRESDPGPQLANLERLHRKATRLARGYRPRGLWAEYDSAVSYPGESELAKRSIVRGLIESMRPARVLDAGCNTGEYSIMAADAGARVIAADADHDAIELLYRRIRKEPKEIYPVVVDLADPSPGMGFMNRERSSFLDRIDAFQPDCVIALGLLHHLLVSANLSILAVRDLLHALTTDNLILEYIPPADPQFRRLVQLRRNKMDRLTLDEVTRTFEERFSLESESVITGVNRTILHFRKRK